MNNNEKSVSVLLPLILIISLFFLWGMANNLNDILITQFKKVFTLSDLKSGLVQSAFYTGYFVFAIPAAIYVKRFSSSLVSDPMTPNVDPHRCFQKQDLFGNWRIRSTICIQNKRLIHK